MSDTEDHMAKPPEPKNAYEVQRMIAKPLEQFVAALRAKHPGEDGLIRELLEGEAAKIRAVADQKVQDEREATKKQARLAEATNGGNGHNGTNGHQPHRK